MNIQKLMYLLLLLALSSINVQAANGRGGELSARQLCERSHSARECLNMEQARHRELEQQRDEDARDNRRDSRRNSRDTSKAAREERQCRRHPEKCASSSTQQDRDDYELQRLCERNYSRQQCLEMYYELHQQRARDQQELRQHEIERRDRNIAPPRVIERRDAITPRDNNSRRLSPNDSEHRESAW